MKSIIKKIAIYSMVGLMQVGLGTSVIEAFEIDRILDVHQAGSLKGGGQGMRYTCRIRSKELFLFCDDERWFVEN